MNHEQAPNAYLPRPRFVFHVTPGTMAAGGYVEPYQTQKVPAADIRMSGANLSITPLQGPVRTHAMLKGSGFPPPTSVSLVCGTQTGSRVSDNGCNNVLRPSRPPKAGAARRSGGASG